jgi:3-deoxy-D-manno-octulosonic-acid transferase
MIDAGGFTVVRASRFRDQPRSVAAGSIFLLDTIGDLAAMYSLGAVAFVGGSLVQAGGHNPLEPARFGVPVLMGSSFENFREIVGLLKANDAVQIVATGNFRETLIAMLSNFDKTRIMGQRGREVFDAQAGATGRTVQALAALLEERVVSGR